MAIFKVPRITSDERKTILLEDSELVFDVDEKIFFGGNNSDLGGFPVGKGASIRSFRKELNDQDIINKYIELPSKPVSTDLVRLNILGGIEQQNSVDFSATESRIIWDGLGLDNFLEQGDVLVIFY